jgi:clathrin heavy chain
MAESGNFDQILPYSRSVGYTPDFNALLQHITRVNPEKGSEFATNIAKEDPSLLDIDRAVDIFQSQGMIQQATSFLLDVLSQNKPEQGHLQTRLLEMNLQSAPQVSQFVYSYDLY